MGLMKLRRLKVNTSIPTPYGRKVSGNIIEVQCDKKNVPIDLFWRARLKDAQIDNCVEFIVEKQLTIKKKKGK